MGVKYHIPSVPSVHWCAVARPYTKGWKVEEYYCSGNQDLGLSDCQEWELRGVIRHPMSVARTHILLMFTKVCMPRLRGASMGQLACTLSRVNSRGAMPTVLFDGTRSYSKAIGHYQMAQAGEFGISIAEVLA